MMRISKMLKSSFPLFLCLGMLWGDVGDEFIANGKGPNELTTPEYLSLVDPFLPHNPNILEAGANSGSETVLFAEKWPEGQVFAFEPVPDYFQLILDRLQATDFSNVRVFPMGLFSESGNRSFYFSQTCGGASSYLPDSNMPGTNYDDKEMILPCITLDDWALQQGVDHIDFMWLDMEGAEYYALSASPRMLCTVKVILTELNFRSFREGQTLYNVLKPFLESYGFTLYKIWGSPHWQGTGMFVKSELLPRESREESK